MDIRDVLEALYDLPTESEEQAEAVGRSILADAYKAQETGLICPLARSTADPAT